MAALNARVQEPAELTFQDIPRQHSRNAYESHDLNKVFSAIEHLGKLRSEGHITEEEFGEYRGKLLKRIV